MVEERRDRLRDARVSLGCRDHLDETEVSRWIEEVRTQHAIPHGRRQTFGDGANRDRGRVRRQHGARRRVPRDAAEKVLLDSEVFDDGLDDPVRMSEARQIVEAGSRDQPPAVRREEGLRPHGFQPVQALARRVGGEVEERDRHTGVGQMRGELCAHRPGAQHGGRPDQSGGLRPRGPPRRSLTGPHVRRGRRSRDSLASARSSFPHRRCTPCTKRSTTRAASDSSA